MIGCISKKTVAIIVVAILIVVSIPTMAVVGTSYSNQKVIVIDAGHGGIDGGVSGIVSKVKESTINLDLAYYVREYLMGQGYKVVLTRSDQSALSDNKQEDMKKRIRIINKSNCILMVSIHVNFYPSAYRRGIQTFYNKAVDEDFATHMQEKLNSTHNYPTVGRNFSALFGDYYILANSNCPACLIETGFISNVEDEKLLLSREYRMLLAYNVYQGIIEWLNCNDDAQST